MCTTVPVLLMELYFHFIVGVQVVIGCQVDGVWKSVVIVIWVPLREMTVVGWLVGMLVLVKVKVEVKVERGHLFLLWLRSL